MASPIAVSTAVGVNPACQSSHGDTTGRLRIGSRDSSAQTVAPESESIHDPAPITVALTVWDGGRRGNAVKPGWRTMARASDGPKSRNRNGSASGSAQQAPTPPDSVTAS